MEVAQVTPVYPPYRGGIGTVAEAYTQQLRDRGESVTVFTPEYNRGFSGNEGEEVFRLKTVVQYGNAAFVPGLFWRLRSVDVIHLHYPFYGGAIVAAMAALVWRKPLVLTYHMKTKAKGWVGWVFVLHRLLIEPFIFWVARAVLVSSLDYARASRVHHKQLVEQPFWVDTEVFRPGSAPYIREYFGIAGGDPMFLFIGGLDEAHYFKGVEVLLQAASQLPEDTAWNVVIAGSGNRLAQYQARALELGLAGRVHYPGKVSEQGLPNLVRESTVHVLPSIDRSEAFGIVTLEAASSGLPSIVSDLPGVRTLVEENSTGMIVPPGDAAALAHAMCWMLDHPIQRREFGERARERAQQRYGRERLVNRLQAVYADDTVEAL